MVNESITFSKEVIKEESNTISIPSFELKKKLRKKYIFEDILKNTLTLFLELSHEKLGQNNSLDSVANILSEKIFGEKTLYEEILVKIDEFVKSNNLKYDNLKNLEIDAGKLYVRFENGEKIVFDLSAKNVEKLVIKHTTKENLKELKEEQTVVDKVLMFGTVVALTYGQIVEFGNAGDRLIDKASMKYGAMKKQKFLEKIEIGTGENKIELNLLDTYKNLRRSELKEGIKVDKVKLYKILKKSGIVYNPETNQFEETLENKLDKAAEAVEYKTIKEKIKKYSYEEYLEDMKKSGIEEKDIIPEKDFKEAKKANLKILEQINSDFNANKNKKLRFGKYLQGEILGGKFDWLARKGGKIVGKSLHLIMFPIFFKEIHKHAGNLDSYIKGGVEFGAFTLGAKIGGKIGAKIVPGLLKPIAGLIGGLAGGGLAAVGGHNALQAFDKEILGVMPNREDFFERIGMGSKKNIEAHVYSGGLINDIADELNKDVGLNLNKIGVNKLIGLFTGDYSEKGYLDINAFDNNVNLGTGVIDYLNERTRGVDHWNKEVEEFKIRATQKTNELLKKDFKYSDVFIDSNTFGRHSFEEDLSNGLNALYNPKNRGGSVGLKYERIAEKNAKLIFEFSKKNVPENMFLGTLEKDEEGKQIHSFDKVIEKLKIFLKQNKILKTEEDIEQYLKYYESIFYKKLDEKIDDILGNPSVIDSLLGGRGEITNEPKKIKQELKDYIIKAYYKTRTSKEKIKKTKSGEIEKTPLEIELSSQIDRLKIDKDYIKEYSKEVYKEKDLIDKAISGELVFDGEKDSIIKYGEYTFIKQKDGNYIHTTGNIDDIIYISKLSKKERKFTKEIFHKILHPEEGNILRGKGSVRKFKKLLENDNYYIFFNRMIDLKRRKVFIKNVELYNDSVEWDVDNSVILNIRKWVVDKVSSIID